MADSNSFYKSRKPYNGETPVDGTNTVNMPLQTACVGVEKPVPDIKAMADFMSEFTRRRAAMEGRYTLITPDGKVYQGSVDEVLKIVAIHHPLFKPKT